ncbi:twin-arginine translocation signal domain-containing protein [Nonomuraea angiospora]
MATSRRQFLTLLGAAGAAVAGCAPGGPATGSRTRTPR